MTLRVYVTGQKAFGVAAAEQVTRLGHTLVGVSSPAYGGTDADLPSAFGAEDSYPDRLRAYAADNGIAWTEACQLTPQRVPACDVIIAAHSQAFVGRLTRARARVAAIGYHPSLLPLHRGRDAVRWTVRDGDRVTGGSIYHLTNGVDCGPLAAQDYVLVPRGCDARSLWRDHLFPLGARLIAKALTDLDQGRVVAVAQDESLATWEPSWERPRLHRPELPELTAAPAEPGGYVLTDPGALR